MREHPHGRKDLRQLDGAVPRIQLMEVEIPAARGLGEGIDVLEAAFEAQGRGLVDGGSRIADS